MQRIAKFALLPLLLILLLAGCLPPATPAGELPTAVPAEELTVAFFDVGQADCALIGTDGQYMLIDAGNVGQDKLILGYLEQYGVTRLEYLVATHPHADHIGAMSAVVYGMAEIGAVLMPQAITTTNVFEGLLTAIEERDLAITVPQPGDSFMLGQAVIEVLAPQGDAYKDLNNYSLVLRVSFGQTIFLFTGDAEQLSEAEQLAASQNVSADVLKTAHHGSSTSTTEAYLAAVSPRYAVISCGRGNSYGHPHAEILARLHAQGVALYRTDENGSVVFNSDGTNITVSAERGEAAIPAESGVVQSGEHPDAAVAQSYIGNKNSHIFHLTSCSSLPAEQNRIQFTNREEAQAQGYKPCKTCQP